jgi:hypothetical protein
MVCRHRAECTFHKLESVECPTVQPTIRLRRSVGRYVFCYLHWAADSKHDFPTSTKHYVWGAILFMRPQYLIGICLTLFLAILAGIIFLSVFLRVVDWVFSRRPSGNLPTSAALTNATSKGQSRRLSASSKDMLDTSGVERR